MKHPLFLLLPIALSLTGCGRPPSAGGPPGDFSVNAVLAKVGSEQVAEVIHVVGSLRARDAIDVASEITAPVKEVLFNEGEYVEAGASLVLLDDAKVSARTAEAEARFKLADTNRKRGEELFANQTISQQEYDQVQAEFGVAQAVYKLMLRELEDTVITAPFAGITSDRNVSPGQYVSAGQPVTRLVKMDPMEIEFRLPERLGSRAAKGSSITLATASDPGNKIGGEVFFVDPVVDSTSRTILIKASVPNSDLKLKPGMFGSVELVLSTRAEALVIPESAIRYRGDQAYVVVATQDLKAEFRNIQVGLRMPGKIEVVQGLAAGEIVVVEGYQKMGPGTGIIISPESSRFGVEAPSSPAP